MKKFLLLLLIIPLVFACSSDESPETLREYLESNIFLNNCCTQNSYPMDYFIEFNFEGSLWDRTIMSLDNPTVACYPETYNDCYVFSAGEFPDGIIVEESDERIIWEWFDPNGDYLIEITRLGNQGGLNVKHITYSGSYDYEHFLTTYDYFNERKNDLGNTPCDC